MNIVFRADASVDIGHGHVVRCLTLATALNAKGANCRFICNPSTGNLVDVIRQRGFEVFKLNCTEKLGSTHSHQVHEADHMYDWEQDAHSTSQLLANQDIDWLVVDHYQLDARWESMLIPHCGRLMVIDDLANRAHVCHLLLDQNLGRIAEDYLELTPASCTKLIGPQFALLDPSFAALRAKSLQRRLSNSLEHILITMGGTDTENATCAALKSLKKCHLPGSTKLTVVMGLHAPYRDEVIQLASTMPWVTDVKVDVRNMAQLMSQCDLAIGGAGTTSWERCCLGLPTLLLALADNQVMVARQQQLNNSAVLLPGIDSLDSTLPQAISSVAIPGVLAAMAVAASEIVDGLGVNRTLNNLMEGV